MGVNLEPNFFLSVNHFVPISGRKYLIMNGVQVTKLGKDLLIFELARKRKYFNGEL